jgi:outer membrane lipoprotein-sorting protein
MKNMPLSNIIILVALCSVVSAADAERHGTGPVATAENDAAPLVDSIISRQKKIASIQCKYHHKQYLNKAAPLEYQGDISYRFPDQILVHFLYPADEYVLTDDSTILIYGIENKYGIRYKKKCLSPAEKQIGEQVGQVKMNLLASMRQSYVFSFSDTSNPEATTISARPLSGWKNLRKILITVNRPKRYLLSIDLYGKDGVSVSSTTYQDFALVEQASVYFPRSLTIIVNAEEITQKDQITYSRIEFNKPFSKNHFSVPVAKDAKIVDNLKDCK